MGQLTSPLFESVQIAPVLPHAEMWWHEGEHEILVKQQAVGILGDPGPDLASSFELLAQLRTLRTRIPNR
jgi:hypothetical protein